MTTLVLAAAPTSELRPVPWRRLLWVAWRRYRHHVRRRPRSWPSWRSRS